MNVDVNDIEKIIVFLTAYVIELKARGSASAGYAADAIEDVLGRLRNG